MNEIKHCLLQGARNDGYSVNGEPSFGGNDVATNLKYTDTKKAFAKHASEDDQNKWIYKDNFFDKKFCMWKKALENEKTPPAFLFRR